TTKRLDPLIRFDGIGVLMSVGAVGLGLGVDTVLSSVLLRSIIMHGVLGLKIRESNQLLPFPGRGFLRGRGGERPICPRPPRTSTTPSIYTNPPLPQEQQTARRHAKYAST